MATLSILGGYGLTQGITTLTKAATTNGNMSSASATNQQDGVNLTTKTFSKITVQNVLSENNRNSMNINNNNNNNNQHNSNNNNNKSSNLSTNNTIVRKIKDFGMVGAVNNTSANATNCVSKSLLIRKRPLGESKGQLNDGNKTMVATTATASKKPKHPKEPKELKDTAVTTPKVPKKSVNSINNNNNNENIQRSRKALNALSLALNGVNPKPAGTPGRKGLPLPQAVARRNARERNRVKQVNNGFAALRERIPEEVAEAFEAQGTKGGNAAKKLSKVETLRMAVEYIRSLERLLGFDFGTEAGQQYTSGSSGEDSYSLIKDEFDPMLSPSMDDNYEDSLSHYDMDDYFTATATAASSKSISQSSDALDTSTSNFNASNPIDLLPNITTLNGLQYIRIPGTNTYQLLTPDIFVGTTHSPPNSSLDDEHFNTLIDTNRYSPAVIGETSPNTTTSIANSIASIQNSSIAPASPSTATSAISTLPAIRTNLLFENGENVAIPLSRLTPVPQMLPTTSSPNPGSSSLYHQHHHQHQHQQLQQHQHQHQQQLQLQQTSEPSRSPTLSPAINEQSSSSHASCATTNNNSEVRSEFVAPSLPHLLPHLIKQEYNDVLDFASTTTNNTNNTNNATITTTKSPNTIAVNVYQTTLSAGDQHEHATISTSPPLECCNRLLIAPHHTTSAIELQSFYEQDDSGSFYENNLSFKKDLDEVLLDASTSATNTGLSDESMIEAIDWWEAHTPQSDGSSAVML